MTRTRLHALTMHLAAALLLCMAGGHALAADWQKVLSDRNRTVEIDRASIFASDGGTKVSWGRVVMSDAGAAAVGYRTIKALNRYDCLNRSFFTIKRVYLDASDRVIREETNADQAPVMVTRNTADERMWREVCRPPGGADLGRIAETAGKAAAAATAVTPTPPAARPAPPRTPTAAVPAPKPGLAAPAPQAAMVPPVPPSAKIAPPPRPTSLAERDANDKAAPPPNAGSTPAALPMPSIRPNLAELAAKNEADRHAPLATAQSPDPRPASPALPTPPLTALAPLPPAPADEPEVATTTPQPRPEPAPAPSAPALAPAARAPARSAPATPVAAHPAPPVLATPAPAPRLDPAARVQTPATRPDGSSAPDLPHRAQHWSYAGDTGPERWGRLHPDWQLCAEGERQSPIDLRNGIAVELDPVKFDYPATTFRITDTGNMLRVDVTAALTMEVRGERYRLEYFTLHRPSQERVGGGASAMAMHLHHRASDGRTAILAVLMERGEDANPLLQVVLNNLPLEKHSPYAPAATIDLGAFLPASPGHFLYMGSMTTPPCTEGVLWVVMKEPVLLSDDQIALFSRLYPRNSRPIQAHKGRRVLESR